ncbi:MAG: 30S ribosomal protein S16 [Rickettsiales bacterium]|jgi:small subunit ribosomal protein S16|nr:30S ribosomal protein S16 [Rickettsiales bacterium]
MAVVIRLALHGAKKNPYYHIVVTDKRNARNSGNILERVGSYDPKQPKDGDKRVVLKLDRIKDWMAKGAKPSDRVYKFLANAGVLAKKAAPVQTKKHLQSEKTLMKIKDKQTKLAKAADLAAEASAKEAAAKAAAAPAPEAAPASEPAAE